MQYLYNSLVFACVVHWKIHRCIASVYVCGFIIVGFPSQGKNKCFGSSINVGKIMLHVLSLACLAGNFLLLNHGCKLSFCIVQFQLQFSFMLLSKSFICMCTFQKCILLSCKSFQICYDQSQVAFVGLAEVACWLNKLS